VLCVPVRDETDELGAMMLAQLLDAAQMQAVPIPVRRVDEIVATVATERPDVVFLSGLPPFGMARAHRLYRSLRSRYPNLRLMIGIWGFTDDAGKASQKISRGDAVHVSTTLADAVAQVRSIFRAAETIVAPDEEPSPANAA
jgi:methylmalonyl-CoA mutase cobalamin-binding subunit